MLALPISENGRVYASGSRKRSVAKVWIAPGSGKFLINDKTPKEYLLRDTLVLQVQAPLVLTQMKDKVDVYVRVFGGGKSGQAGAIRHGLSRALTLFKPELRPILKKAGFLTRDPREVERKKYGLHKARKRYQYSKR